jgi:putative IMPACT (imprinted ancient) family translation regulator
MKKNSIKKSKFVTVHTPTEQNKEVNDLKLKRA